MADLIAEIERSQIDKPRHARSLFERRQQINVPLRFGKN